ncbi:MAG: DUF11 domain-containing protein [Caldilineaceae bacterium]|nr:DUF11 domain-containing protein [Caldilineaceae bacterium]
MVCASGVGSVALCDGFDTPLQGVTVTLYYAPDSFSPLTLIMTKTTGVTGSYVFTDLLPGIYQIVETNLPGYVSVADADGPPPDEIVTALGVGEVKTGQHFEDRLLNADVRIVKSDSTDPITAGQTLTYTLVISNAGPDTAQNVLVTDTLPAGVTFQSADPVQNSGPNPLGWSLGNLAISQTQTITVVVTVNNNTSGVITNTAVVTSTTPDLVPGNNEDDEPTTVDALLATIGGAVYDDLNANGVQDVGEPGLSNVLITLSNGVTTTTSASGLYTFTNLIPGGYTITETDPVGYASTGAEPGTIGSTVVNDNQISVNVLGGQSSLENDFLDAVAASVIGDFVWNDLNNNGIQDVGEPGIPAVLVNLYDGTNTQILSTTTDAGGLYTFTQLISDTYRVEIDASAFLPGGALYGQSASPVGQGGDPSKDSDGNVVTHDVTVALPASTTNLDIDFGFVLVADLAVDKSSEPKPHTPGQPITYTIVVTNAGPGTLTALTLTDVLPASVSPLMYIASEGIYTSTTGAWTGVNLTTTNSITLTIKGAVDANSTGAISNTAIVSSTGLFDPNPGNNEDEDENPQSTGQLVVEVYEDVNDNGVRDAGEGLPGVDVLVTPSVGSAFTVTTDADGLFTTTVASGTTGVDVDDTDLPAGASQTVGTTRPASTCP